jgi:opacity protein-like surface antigen
MKKVFAIMTVAVVMCATAFAQEEDIESPNEGTKKSSWLSAGVGGFIGGDFGGGGAELFNHDQGRGLPNIITQEKESYPYFGGGGFLFLDVKYAELTLGFFGGNGASKYTQQRTANTNSGYTDYESETDVSYASFNIGLLLKFPFGKNDKFSIFPLLGIDYQIMLSAKGDGKEYTGYDGDGKPGDFSALWIKIGGGFDIAITNKIYTRLEALYGIRTASKVDEDIEDRYKKIAKGLNDINQDTDVSSKFGHGLTVKLAVGYKF